MNFIKSKSYTLETKQSIEYIQEAFNLKIKEAKEKRGKYSLFLYPDYSSISVLNEKIIIDDVLGNSINRDARIGRVTVYLSPLHGGTRILAKTEPYESQVTLPLAGLLFALFCSAPVLKFHYHLSNLCLLITLVAGSAALFFFFSIAVLILKKQMISYLKSVFWGVHIEPDFIEVTQI